MRTLESIKAEIAALGEVDLFGTAKEVSHLPEILHDDENIKYLTSGLMDGTTWLVVCTQKRVILLDHGFLFGFKQSEMNLENINSISFQTGLLFGSIEIWHGGARMLIENCDKKTVKPFTDAVNAAMQAIKKSRGVNLRVQLPHLLMMWSLNLNGLRPCWKKAFCLRKNSKLKKRSYWNCNHRLGRMTTTRPPFFLKQIMPLADKRKRLPVAFFL